MPLGSVLLHVGVPIRETQAEEYVEGEPATTEPIPGTPFDCLYLVNAGGREQNVPKGKRVLEGPVILFEPFDVTGADFSLDAADQVLITAEEHFGPEAVKFEVDGEPTPMAKPGFMVGFEAALKRVND